MAASVILAKCVKTGRTYGIRVEKRENDWVRTWAFAIDEAKAKREGFDKNKIKGSLDATPEYPGCPFCGTNGFIQCGFPCDKLSCYDGGKTEGKSVTLFRCPWCGKTAKEIQIVETFSVKSDRF